MQFELDRVLRCIRGVPLTPVVADGVREDIAVLVEAGGGDAATDFGVAFQTVLGVLVPEVESAVGAGGAEGAMLWVEGDRVDGVDFCDVARGGVLLAVAFEGEVEAAGGVSFEL